MASLRLTLPIWLIGLTVEMRKHRYHQGLKDRPVRPPNNAAATTREEYKQELSQRQVRLFSLRVSTGVPEALEILPNDPNKELAKKFIDKSIVSS